MPVHRLHYLAIIIFLSLWSSFSHATPRIMALGDSITNGGQGFASYRYPLYFDLLANSYDVNFVGNRNTVYLGDVAGNPDLALYPDYYLSFDRDHEGYWGQTTDYVLNNVIDAVMPVNQPDVVLIHLGTNDLGQSGAAGVAQAVNNLPQIIQRIRNYRPMVRILLAQLIPIGPGTGYFSNAAQVAVLNSEIVNIAASTNTAESPVIVVDLNSGFDISSHMQGDGLHPNLAGEVFMATAWLAALQPVLDDIGDGFPLTPPPLPTAAELDFEIPVLGDSSLAAGQPGPGTVSGWQFSTTSASNYAGIYNPPATTYTNAGGSATPTGASGANVAYLVNMQAGATVAVQRVIGVLQTNHRYQISVAVGQRLGSSPYSGVNFGGYQIELMVNGTAIANVTDAVTSVQGSFVDATLMMDANNVSTAFHGELLSLRLSPSSTNADIHVDFDNVRIVNILIGDLDNNDVVNSQDIGIMMQRWDSTDTAANLDGIGNVDSLDLALLLQALE